MATALSNNAATIQLLLQQADHLTQQAFGPRSTLSVVHENHQFGPSKSIYVSSTTTTNEFGNNNNGVIMGEVDEATVNHIIQSVSKVNQYQQNQTEQFRTTTVRTNEVATPLPLVHQNLGEIYRDPNPPEIIRRPAQQGAVTYRQNVSVRFLQPPPAAPPGVTIDHQGSSSTSATTAPPLLIRQQAPPLPTPRPLILRERPPPRPVPVPPKTLIRQLPAIPVPPRSVIVERFPAIPARPQDIIIERWLPYEKVKKRRVIIQRAPPPRPYPQPRNAIVVHDPVKANVVRVVQKAGVQPQNPDTYVDQFGHSLLDAGTLITHAQQLGIADNLSPPLIESSQQFQSDNAQYYIASGATTLEPQFEYNTTTVVEPQQEADKERVQVYWINPYEDVRVAIQRLGIF